ncbi:MAG TPA: hypothetical protein VMM92_09250 [Thermoanaerobaculia bacterium]|nr:hypothetical protein [Thermoanaerobaculia bacterium]
MNRFATLVLALTLVTSALAGCSGSGHSPSESSSDAISITGISPTAGGKLAPGSTVTFTANVSYQLSSAATGTIVLSLEDQLSNPLQTGTQPSVTVNQGQGTTSLTDHLTIPASGVTQIQVFVSLTPAGAAFTNTVALVTYPVGT